ncbi:MAG: hypothetical protein HY904_03050 [Deltaproteobacteria bacterium]|nr:hypothetical protein [Deltaproteobacteria bacterium]
MTTGDRLPGVAVFDADAPPAVAFTRSLGARGVPVTVYSPHRTSAAGASRFAAATARCPPPDQPERFLVWLEAEFRAGRIGCVAPTSDNIAFCLAELHDLLPPALQRVLPAPAAARNALFKDRFHGVLQTLSFPAPRTAAPRTPDEAEQLATTLRFPVVIKPRAHVGAMLDRGTVVRDQRALRRHFTACHDGSPMVLARYPSLRLPMLQEYVPGALQNLYSVSGLLGCSGEVLAVAGARKTAQWPPTLGVGTRFEPWLDAAAMARGAELARAVLGTGIFELEFIWDAERQALLAIDLNPRGFGQISLDVARGNDLPWEWYRLYRGDTLSPRAAPRPDVHWRHALPFHVDHVARVVRGPHRVREAAAYLTTWREPAVDIVLDTRDVLPAVVYTARMLRHPGGLVRPFLRAPAA